MDESILVGSIIDKLPQSWWDHKKNLKHRKNEMSLKELAKDFQIKKTLVMRKEGRSIKVFGKDKHDRRNALCTTPKSYRKIRLWSVNLFALFFFFFHYSRHFTMEYYKRILNFFVFFSFLHCSCNYLAHSLLFIFITKTNF